MTLPPGPEVPYPYPPERPLPERRDPIVVPVVYEPSGPLERLLDRRTILLGGELDSAKATRIAAELMSLDGHSDRPIDLLVNSPGGPVDEVFAVIDVIGLVRGPVRTTCIGQARGTAAAVLAAGTGRRRATPNATISLRCDQELAIPVTAHDLEQQAAQVRQVRARLVATLVAATRMSREDVEREVDHGAPHPAAVAVDLGIVDEIAATTAGAHS